MLSQFDDYARELRRAKDQEEFDRFMANRNKPTSPTAGGPTTRYRQATAASRRLACWTSKVLPR